MAKVALQVRSVPGDWCDLAVRDISPALSDKERDAALDELASLRARWMDSNILPSGSSFRIHVVVRR